MKMGAVAFVGWLLVVTPSEAKAQQPQPPRPRVVDMKASDGTLFKATYFPAGKPGPGVLLFHQNNRTRTSWEGVARELAGAGINALTVDGRGHGESGGSGEDYLQNLQIDAETSFQFLISQPGVQRDVIGLAGAGWHGVVYAFEIGRSHTASIKSLVMLSGDYFPPDIDLRSNKCSGCTTEPPVLSVG